MPIRGDQLRSIADDGLEVSAEGALQVKIKSGSALQRSSDGIDILGGTPSGRVLLFDNTLSAAGVFDIATYASLGTISQDYDHLEFILTGKSTSATQDYVRISLNEDTTAGNYASLQQISTTSGTSVVGAANRRAATISKTGGLSTEIRGSIKNYTGISAEKLVSTEAWGAEGTANTDLYSERWATLWNNTAAISKIEFDTKDGTDNKFAAGTRLQIIGTKLTASKDYRHWQTSVASDPGNTLELRFLVPTDITVIGIKLWAKTSPTSTGYYRLYVDGAGNNLLGSTYEGLKTLSAETLTAVTLTSTTADLDLDTGDIVTLTFDSEETDLSVSGLIAEVVYQARSATVTSTDAVTSILPEGYAYKMRLTRNSDTTIRITVGSVRDEDNTVDIISDAALDIDITASGVNGLDTGSVAADTVYHFYVIQKDDGTQAGVASLSASGPTVMPEGYTKYRRRGAWATDGASDLHYGWQRGDGKNRLFLYKTQQLMRSIDFTAVGDTVIPTTRLSRYVPVDSISVLLRYRLRSGDATGYFYLYHDGGTTPFSEINAASSSTEEHSQTVEMATEAGTAEIRYKGGPDGGTNEDGYIYVLGFRESP